MIGRCVCILMVLSLANGKAALAGTQGLASGPYRKIASSRAGTLRGYIADLHEHPELAFHEERTAGGAGRAVLGLLASRVTTGVGQTGLVAILRNGSGRSLCCAQNSTHYPSRRQTGLPFASKSKGLDSEGKDGAGFARMRPRPLHMTGWYGTAKIMARRRHTLGMAP